MTQVFPIFFISCCMTKIDYVGVLLRSMKKFCEIIAREWLRKINCAESLSDDCADIENLTAANLVVLLIFYTRWCNTFFLLVRFNSMPQRHLTAFSKIFTNCHQSNQQSRKRLSSI